jgi:hypothetical protein
LEQFDGGPGERREERLGMLIHTLAHGPFGRDMLVAEGFTEEVVTAILFNGHKIALGLSQKAAVALEYIGMRNGIVRGNDLRQARWESGETVQGKTNEGNAGMGGVELLV